MVNNPQQSKLPNVGTTIFSVMSALARDHGAINLSQGFPDFNCDPKLIQWVQEAMLAGHNQYAPMPGLPLLRNEISRLQAKLYGAKYDPDTEITISSGATEALSVAMAAFIRPGDEVIYFEPAYDAYQPNIELHGGVSVPLPLSQDGYQIDWDQVRDNLNPKTRAIIINSPHNPTGSTLRPDDIKALKAILAEHEGIIVISDEVYEHMVYDGQPHLSLSAYPEIAARAVVISSFGKTLHTTGWKVGYAMAPPALTVEFRKVHQYTVFAVPTPFQHAIARYMQEEEAKILNLKHFYQQKRDYFLQEMKGSRFEPVPCEGTYFQLMRYDQISERSEADFSRWLTTEVGVAAIPVSAFYGHETNAQVVRFCFAKEEETLRRAAEKLQGL